MKEYDLVVIGAGPGGYVAAIRAAQLGLSTACIEKEERLGGTCARVGCIPSKALLESSEQFHSAKKTLAEHGVKTSGVELDLKVMMARKEKTVADSTAGVALLFKKNKITRYAGMARLESPREIVVDSKDGEQRIAARHVIIATGSVPAALPGIEFDGDRIGSSTEGLEFSEVPRHLVVIGAGYIGLELGSVWLRLGARVTVLEYLDRILPGMDSDIAREAQKIFTRQGIEFRLGCKVTGARVRGKTCHITIEGADELTCDRVLVAVGRKPNTHGLGLAAAGVETDERGRVRVDPQFRTNIPGVYAIGDVIHGPMLAHKAEEEGMACVEQIVKGHSHVNYDAIPGVVYTDPEIASVGKTEDELKAAGVPYRKGEFPFRANGRARAIASTDGKVKILAHQQTDRVLGVHIIGAHAGDLIAEAAAAIEFGASAEDLARTSHAHPTLAEAIKEAALAVDGRAIHF